MGPAFDHERPLARRRRKAVALLREHFGESGVVPDLVLCSVLGPVD
jgi:hypothetical protein